MELENWYVYDRTMCIFTGHWNVTIVQTFSDGVFALFLGILSSIHTILLRICFLQLNREIRFAGLNMKIFEVRFCI